MRRLIVAVCFALVFCPAMGKEVIVKAGQIVLVRLAQNINANIDHAGERIYFEVIEDVAVDGELAIARGAMVQGIITDAKTRKSLGRAGDLDFEARNVSAVDGQRVRLERDNINVEGRARTGATVVHTVIWGPVGLFARGRAAYALLDTEYELEVAADIVVDTGATPKASGNAMDDSNLTAAASIRKIRTFKFSKGKVRDDIILDLQLPREVLPSEVTSIQITDAANHRLFKPVEAISTEINGHGLIANFDFWSLMKFAVPGETPIAVLAQLRDGREVVANTSLTSEWKMK